MADENKTTGSVVKDPTLDLRSLMGKSSSKEEKPENVSPLDQAAKKKADGIGLGAIVKTADLSNEPLRHLTDSDERREDFDDEVNEQEETNKKAELVGVIRKPTNPRETVEMMSEISESIIDGRGKIHVPEGAKYIRSKEELESLGGEHIPFKDAKVNMNGQLAAETKAPEVVKEEPKEKKNDFIPVTEDTDVDAVPADEEDPEKAKIVKLLIDKTGYGKDIVFKDYEEKVLQTATAIQLVEVEDRELKTMKVARDLDNDLPFVETIAKQNLAMAKANIVFPLSGFRADMTSLSMGDFIDISLDTDTDTSDDMVDFDKLWRMCSTIYNNMINPTCGKFKDFDDFLKRFAFMDTFLGVYGLLIATKDNDEITITCQKDDCGTVYQHHYNARTLIDFANCDKGYLKAMDRVHDATGDGLYKVAEESPVRSVKAVRLPSGVILEYGPISCYEYLYNYIRKVKEYADLGDKINENNGEAVDGVNATDLAKSVTNLMLMQVVRGFRVPGKDGGYAHIFEADKVLEYMNHYLPSEDYAYVRAIVDQAAPAYTPSFCLRGLKCPKCGNYVEKISVDIYTLVFQAHQHMMTTSIELKELELF